MSKASKKLAKVIERLNIIEVMRFNLSQCGNLKELNWEDEEFSPLNIRDEDEAIRLDELIYCNECDILKSSKGLSSYPKEWTFALRWSIKERDNFTCYLCQEKEMVTPHHVHHIDYNKTNCKKSNLVTLCPSCHMRTNGNRDEWQKFFEGNL